jgi:hypothetical protein
LQSDIQRQCYKQLADLLARLQAVLQKGQETDLAALVYEYATLMAALPQAAGEAGASDYALLVTLHQEVASLLVTAEQQRDTLGRQLAGMGKRQQQVGAYIRAQKLM